MKYLLANIFGICTIVLGIATTAQADLTIPQSSISTDRTPKIWRNNTHNVIGYIKSNPAVSQPQSSSTVTMNSLELNIYNQINRYRQSRNLSPLIIDPLFSAQARAHSEEMAKTGNLHHQIEPFSQQIAYASAAENIASSRGYRNPDLVAIEDWINSPDHHRNTIGRYNFTGIGVAQNAKGEYYFTQIFIYKR
jgi:uncharacterized protein YkwD